jgi:hypothetical protein
MPFNFLSQSAVRCSNKFCHRAAGVVTNTVWVTGYLIWIGLFVAPSASAQTTVSINFDQYTGPSTAPITAQNVQVDVASFTGGGFCTACTNTPHDQTTIYITTSTDPNLGLACNGCASTITITFSQPVSNLSLLLINGEPYDVNYQVQDNQGHTVQAYVGYNTGSSGAMTVSLPYPNIQKVVVSKVIGGLVNGWDFAIDNVTYTRPCTATSVAVQTNPSCNSSLGPCSANIVQGNGTEQTKLFITVQPPQQTLVQLSADYGTPSNVQTNANGSATTSYAAAQAPNDASTTIGSISASVCGTNYPNLAQVYNLAGFTGFNFHQAQVSDQRFTASAEWGVSDIQAFFQNKGSFLAKFYLVGSDAGFLDTNGNGKYDSGEPTYCASGTACSLTGRTVSAAQAFVNAATNPKYSVNPKLLLDTAQKEEGLISSGTLPAASTLNIALGCGSSSTFLSQLSCAGQTLANQFNSAPTEPHFFNLGQGILHFVYSTQNGVLGQKPVGFPINTKATYSLYRYNPYIEEVQGGGGFYLFEQLWQQYQF